jgi:predicted transcriptional regulator
VKLKPSNILPSTTLGRVRVELYHLIAESPGLHFRELQRRTKMATGQLLYHLNYMIDKSVVNARNDGQYLRFFTPNAVNEEDRCIISLARQDSVRHILLYLMANNYVNHEKIVESIDLSPSTISWHLKKLVKAGIVVGEERGRKTFYFVKDPEKVMGIFVKYRESFVDKLVDHFIDMWDELPE